MLLNISSCPHSTKVFSQRAPRAGPVLVLGGQGQAYKVPGLQQLAVRRRKPTRKDAASRCQCCWGSLQGPLGGLASGPPQRKKTKLKPQLVMAALSLAPDSARCLLEAEGFWW